VLSPNAAALAAELAQKGWSPEGLRAWLEEHLPGIEQAARRSGGDPAALLVWRLRNAAELPGREADVEEPLSPLRPLRPEEQAAWEATLARLREELPIPAQVVLDGLKPLGIADQEGVTLVVEAAGGATWQAHRLVGTRVFQTALFDAFRREMRIILHVAESQ